MVKRLSLLFCLISTVILITSPAMATIYTDEAAFIAAAGSLTTEDFNDGLLSAGLTSILGSDVFYPQTGYSAFAGQKVMYDAVNDDLVPSTTFSFSSPITAFGGLFDLAGPGGYGTGIAVYAGSTYIGEISNQIYGTFWGFTSTTPFTTVAFSEGTQLPGIETYLLENLSYGYTTTVPEPASMLLLGLGLVGLAGIKRKMHK